MPSDTMADTSDRKPDNSLTILQTITHNTIDMRKIIAIGESVLDTMFIDGRPVKSFVGGRIACAAASLASLGLPCKMLSECTTDAVGDIIMNYLSQHGVDIKSVDRYPDGATAFSAIFPTGSGKQIVNYGSYPKMRFDIVWPRIDEDDIVLFGSLYAIDLPQRKRLYDLLKYAVERRAILIYLPGFQHGIGYRLTKVMPHLLENLEISDIVIAHDQDIHDIFPGETGDEAYHNHIEFYCRNYVHITRSLGLLMYSLGLNAPAQQPAVDNLLGWQAGLTAGIIAQLFERNILRDQLLTLDKQTWQEILIEARKMAEKAAASDDNCL